MIIKIALKTLKLILKNAAVLPILIGMPIFQLFLIKQLMEESMPVVQQVFQSSIMEVVYIQETLETTMTQNYAASLLVMFILITGIMASSALISEKEQKTMLRVFSTPIRKLQYILGSLLGHLIFMMGIAFSLILITRFGMDIYWGSSWLLLFIVTLLVMFVAIALGFCFSGLFRSSKLASGVMSFIIVIMTFMSGGLTFSGSFGRLSDFTINKWAFGAYISLMKGEGFDRISQNLLILLALGLILTLLSVLIYRRENIYE